MLATKICESQTIHLSPIPASRDVKQRHVNSGILVGFPPLVYTHAVGMHG